MISESDAKLVAKDVRQLQECKSQQTQAEKRRDEQWQLVVERLQEIEGLEYGDQAVVEAQYRKHYPPLTGPALNDIELAFKYAGVLKRAESKPSVREEPLRLAAKNRKKVGKSRVKRMVKVEGLLDEGKHASARKKAEEEVLHALRLLGRAVWDYRDILPWARVDVLYKRFKKDWHAEHRIVPPKAQDDEGAEGAANGGA
jgi:hypothetical protein